jgi:hypothetical protein
MKILILDEICFDYSDKPDVLRTVLAQCVFSYVETGLKKHFLTDQEERRTIRVTITRPACRQQRVSFPFGLSRRDTNAPTRLPSLYDIITCIKCDFDCPASFAEFCGEFGYNHDSIADLKLFTLCTKQAKKLHKIFTVDEILSFPSQPTERRRV